MFKRQGLKLDYLDDNDEEDQFQSPKLLGANDLLSQENSELQQLNDNALQSTKYTQVAKELFQEAVKKSRKKNF